MSIVTTRTITCDECGAQFSWREPRGDNADVLYFLDHVWKHHDGKDYCERCEVPA